MLEADQGGRKESLSGIDMIQNYYCEICKKASHVEHFEGDGAWKTIQDMGDSHRQMSPDCPNGYRGLRIFDEQVFELANQMFKLLEADKPTA